MFCSNTNDLLSIHDKFNKFLTYNNHQVLIEKELMRELEFNEEKLLKQIHFQEIEIWFAKFQHLNFKKFESINTHSTLFLNSLNNLNQELSEFRNLINLILVKDTNKINCMNKIGCFNNSKIIFNKDQSHIQIALEKIQIAPKIVVLETCPFYNDTFVYDNHKKINELANCKNVRPLTSKDFFYSDKVILIIANGSYSFSCAKPISFYVNNNKFYCKNIPKIFFRNLMSFKLNEEIVISY